MLREMVGCPPQGHTVSSDRFKSLDSDPGILAPEPGSFSHFT